MTHKRIKIKICGITRLEDATLARDHGCDLLGFIFTRQSPRYITAQIAAPMIETLREKGCVEIAGVFKDQPLEEVLSIAGALDLDYVQLHGEEDENYIAGLDRPVIKAIVYGDDGGNRALAKYSSSRTILLDLPKQGMVIDKTSARKELESIMAEAEHSDRRIMVAGGLDADSIVDLLNRFSPWAIDLCSAVESGPGIKDRAKTTKLLGLFQTISKAKEKHYVNQH
ncbi:MAG TPA: phosphoribosylanthranilate isomerase [Candidatus Melainabacteria bacterium]|nr:phosphoribosylanthranilate isomerase [Candidatus Melainabacteria bacterium]